MIFNEKAMYKDYIEEHKGKKKEFMEIEDISKGEGKN